jgi:hypothetical protein
MMFSRSFRVTTPSGQAKYAPPERQAPLPPCRTTVLWPCRWSPEPHACHDGTTVFVFSGPCASRLRRAAKASSAARQVQDVKEDPARELQRNSAPPISADVVSARSTRSRFSHRPLINLQFDRLRREITAHASRVSIRTPVDRLTQGLDLGGGNRWRRVAPAVANVTCHRGDLVVRQFPVERRHRQRGRSCICHCSMSAV